MQLRKSNEVSFFTFILSRIKSATRCILNHYSEGRFEIFFCYLLNLDEEKCKSQVKASLFFVQ